MPEVCNCAAIHQVWHAVTKIFSEVSSFSSMSLSTGSSAAGPSTDADFLCDFPVTIDTDGTSTNSPHIEEADD